MVMGGNSCAPCDSDIGKIISSSALLIYENIGEYILSHNEFLSPRIHKPTTVMKKNISTLLVGVLTSTTALEISIKISPKY